jgi:hypothetical protein
MPPDSFGVAAAEVKRKFNTIIPQTTIHEFPFGSGEYDRWAMVLGRLEMETPAPKAVDGDPPPGAVLGEIVCRGEALIFLWAGP